MFHFRTYLLPDLAAHSWSLLSFLFPLDCTVDMCETFNITEKLSKKTEKTWAPSYPQPHPPSHPRLPDNNCWILHWIYTRLCFPCKYFLSISQQICHSQTQCRNASVRHYRDGTFQAFVLCWLLGAAASNRPFFISHLVVWGVTARPSESITHIPHPRPPPSALDCRPFLRGCVRCLMSAAHRDNAPLDLWPQWGKGRLNLMLRSSTAIVWGTGSPMWL